jgi:enterochelin esterase-like enzyme
VIGRRAFLAGLAATAAACSKSERASGSSPPPTSVVSSNVRVLEWDLGEQPWGPSRAVVVVPAWASPPERYPVLVALHGRGEAVKAPADGAMGWPRDYAMVRAIDRLRAPPLTTQDYEGFADPVCPHLPDVRPATTGDVSVYGRFLLDVLLPRVRRETPALAGPESTGIDGVSLGGVVALRIGLANPGAFGAVGGIQPAVQEGENSEWTARAQSARARRPGLALRLLTSHDDYFHDGIVGISRAWRAAGVVHDFADVPGPHDYVFNRGPGSIELLSWHDRVLSRG